MDGSGVPLLLRRADRAPFGAFLLVIAILWLAAASRGLADEPPTIMAGLGAAGAYIAGALGAAFAVVALEWMVRGRTVAIGHGTVAVTVRSLLGRRAWREPLASYRELRVVRELQPHRYGGRSWYVVRLCHADTDKEIELARATDSALIDRRARDYADRLGLPLSWHRDAAAGRAHDGERRSRVAAATHAREPLSWHRDEATRRVHDAERRSGAGVASVAGEPLSSPRP